MQVVAPLPAKLRPNMCPRVLGLHPAQEKGIESGVYTLLLSDVDFTSREGAYLFERMFHLAPKVREIRFLRTTCSSLRTSLHD